MKQLIHLSLAVAAAAVCSAASAGVVTFENEAPNIYSHGDLIQSGEQTVTVRGSGGFDAAVVNGSDPYSCSLAVCPRGNASHYYTALNDGGLSLQIAGGDWRTSLRSLDFAFVLAVDEVVGFTVGQLIVTANDGSSVARDFELQNSNGFYEFANWDLGAYSLGRYSEFTISACLYTNSGSCVNPAGNQAQFAVDNIAYNVPEPANLALVAIGLAGMAVTGRRRKSLLGR